MEPNQVVQTTEAFLSLTMLEVIFLSLSIAAISLNIYQLIIFQQEKKRHRKPLINSLYAVFGQIKALQLTLWTAQRALFLNHNPHTDIQTLKWEVGQFHLTLVNSLNGLQASVVAVLRTVNPEDPEGAQAFRVDEFGLSASEKKLREAYLASQQPISANGGDEPSGEVGAEAD